MTLTPRNLFLNLNNDIRNSNKVRITKELRNELLDYAMDVIEDHYSKEIMANLSKIQDPDRYYNWYQGYTQVVYPYFDHNVRQLAINMETTAISGNISTQYFGEKFDAEKVDGLITGSIRIHIPNVPNVTDYDSDIVFMVSIEKNTILDFSSADWIGSYTVGGTGYQYLDAETTQFSINYSMKDLYLDNQKNWYMYTSGFSRYLSKEHIQSLEMDMMPGFRLTWKFNGHLEQVSQGSLRSLYGLYGIYLYNPLNVEFVRLFCCIVTIYVLYLII